ncbi:MAG: sigma-54-dependent Fis family transcriptional regulator [Nitrospirae bacterium]|nr:sigma-54-dependent Fis family transcriptional regulator [Nitrospirota bacterium]
MPEHILIVDDEKNILQTLSPILQDEGYEISTAENGTDALRFVREDAPVVVLLDIWLPDIDGIEVLKKIKEQQPEVIVIMMSGHGTIETAVKATKLGAYDFIEKPLSMEKVSLIVKHAIDRQRLEEDNLLLRQKIEKKYELIGRSEKMEQLKEQIMIAGPSSSRVLISGENGTGKELVARSIHNESPRRGKPFVEVNCAAIPDTLIESELFGHEKGAFTGATAMKRGKFEQADGGTIFLDEIGDMSLATQAKVLRVLQEQEFQRVGGAKTIRVDVRVIAASNKNLKEEIKKGSFREDLFYRLNVIPLHVPPVRERKEDMPLLVEHFLMEFSREYGIKPKKIAEDVIKVFQEYNWPGNVRELKNIVERLMIMTKSPVIAISDIPKSLKGDISLQDAAAHEAKRYDSFKDAVNDFEKEYITTILKENDWNISKTADALQLDRSHLHRKIKALNIIFPVY